MVTSSHHPPPVRWLVGVELARYREEARLSMSKASTLSGITKAKIAHLETGRQQQSPEDIAKLLEVYGASGWTIARLGELASRADDANWWMPWAAAIPPWLSTFVGLERIAEREFHYEVAAIIPALLQTRAYAEALTAGAMLVRADLAERVVDLRMARATRLTDPDRPLRLHAVINSAALDGDVGGSEVRDGQLRHLVETAELPTVTIQVLRPEDAVRAGYHASGFVLLNFDAVSECGYVELLDDAVYVYDRDRLRTYRTCAADLQRVALDPERSLALIQSKIT
jgi:transcriptional regulator with XRE-family HTH domain